jgi:hypothetical protein
MQPLPDTVAVHPDRGMIGLYDDNVDTFDPALPGATTNGVLLSNSTECYLRTTQTHQPVTLHFPPTPPTTDPLGEATLEFPTGTLIISEITRGITHGPYHLTDGPGTYRLTIHTHTTSTATPSASDTERYDLVATRTGALDTDEL